MNQLISLIKDYSAVKNLIDQAWIIFYWISQNIEYDTEAYFSGNTRYKSSNHVFLSKKSVCDGFESIFEADNNFE